MIQFIDCLPLIIEILSGIAVCIPLVAKLVKYVELLIKEKNWNTMLQLVLNLMAEAEQKFENGADRKQWVLAMVQASATSINYDIDINEIGRLVDNLVALTKKINYTTIDAQEIERLITEK